MNKKVSPTFDWYFTFIVGLALHRGLVHKKINRISPDLNSNASIALLKITSLHKELISKTE